MTTLPEEAVKAPERIRVAQDAEGFWTCREAISGSTEYIRADLAFLPVQGAVKKLEWKTERADKMNGVDTERNGFHEFGYYSITGKTSGCFVSTFDNMGRVRHVDMRGFGSIEAAKAAAQADYEARILSALEPSAARSLALEALRSAEQFIENGFEFGFIRKPDEGDTALETLPKIKAAIRTLSSPDHADAGKVEGDGIGRGATVWIRVDENKDCSQEFTVTEAVGFDDVPDGEYLFVRDLPSAPSQEVAGS